MVCVQLVPRIGEMICVQICTNQIPSFDGSEIDKQIVCIVFLILILLWRFSNANFLDCNKHLINDPRENKGDYEMTKKN